MNKDPLAQYETPQGDWLKQLPARIRILEVDPLVYTDEKFANTHFVFRVYNYDEKKVQILDKTPAVMNRIVHLHKDKDYGADIIKLDIKISSTGSGKETRYTLDVLPNPTPLTGEQMRKMVASIDLETIYAERNARRLSELQEDQNKSSNQGNIPGAKSGDISPTGDIVLDDVQDEPIDLIDCPF